MDKLNTLISFTESGLYVPPADVYIDPWRPVDKALITHAHSDHARWGMGHYLTQTQGAPVLKKRLGNVSVQTLDYGKEVNINGVVFTFYPSGHVLGSAQIKVSYRGESWVAAGDFKLEDDGITPAFEPVRCDAFITESTFGLPVYQWEPQRVIASKINAWWAANAAMGKNSVIYAYALGKAQRVLHMLNKTIGPIYVHGAVKNMNEAYLEAGIELPDVYSHESGVVKGAMIIAPPSADGSPWLKRFEPCVTAIASGWMGLRGARRRRATDTGFVLSDHADWLALNSAVKATGASRIFVTHGYTATFAAWLREQGYDAIDVDTQYTGEQIEKAKEEEG